MHQEKKNFQIEPDEIHADFELSSSGEYIGLISPDGKTVVSEIAPKFEKQNDDESYGLGVWGNRIGSSSFKIILLSCCF